ncbi:MAG TPA: DUF3817 domain-containing protein [Candidatus Corynebacterium gallistercoris]|uniref:DUF3817 domain-containing protein n=1 Tax=Candidatus Corynebacterium gallistercoris TaxID=2838530 RepID=A0A9D1RYD8_9CORY|nr:DUF3817 domain-containing protein [Candidatus Corynebacterium gallistercoris]
MSNNTVHPARQARVAKSLKFYSAAAFFTGIWLLILTAEVIWTHLVVGKGNEPEWFQFIGPAHGLVFIVYVITCLDLGTKARWQPSKWLTTMLAGVVPFLSFYVEKKRREEVKETFQLN